MNYSGELRKMIVHLNDDNSVSYKIKLVNTDLKTEELINANDLIGKDISFKFEGQIICKSCGKKTKNSFNQGFCYPCFKNAPESSECIIKPELCRAHLGEGRDIEWEERNHNQPHIVYLAASDVIKVGVTRETQVPTRWIDQGAAYAIRLAETPNRFLAGQLEVALKSEFTDKTNWRKMLKNEIDESLDLEEVKWELEELLPDDLSQYFSEDDEIISFNYPVLEYPQKVKSLSLDKEPVISGKLLGIKGQYFLFDDNRVMNIRKHTSYSVSVSI
jgi:hypothetical protein